MQKGLNYETDRLSVVSCLRQQNPKQN